MNEEIQLAVIGLVYNQNVAGTYSLVLGEVRGNRRFSIMIGESEAQSIALKLKNKTSPRPLTHDLIHNLLTAFNSHLRKVVIYEVINDVFFAELHIINEERKIVIDARTSDAVAIAIRSGAPIYVNSKVLDNTAVVVLPEIFDKQQESDENTNPKTSNADNLEHFSISDLKNMLQKALDEEKYEFAAVLRDALERKSGD